MIEVALALAIIVAIVLATIAAREWRRRSDAELAVARAEREAEAREGLLRTVVEAAPMAIVLFTESGKIVFNNREARELFFEGRSLEGENFLGLLRTAPDPLRRAVLADRDELVTTDDEGDREVWALSKRDFKLGEQLHTLLLVKQLTSAVDRQEVATWRRIIRILSHELNNSLAPVSSLVHSARVVVRGSELEPKLARVFDTIGDRADHLKSFLDGYARFARLPAPRRQEIALEPLVAKVATMYPRVSHSGDAVAWADPGQIEQVLINLVKNAAEAGDGPIEVEITAHENSTRVAVRDRGAGMSEEVLQNAILPFYSTKDGGSGIGLALSREIVEAHGGRLRLRNREGGGAEVSFRIPARGAAIDDAHAKLTLTRV